ncbi:MAG: hypothetical protein AABX75_00360, partial [Nanoarchaeota archaeon]
VVSYIKRLKIQGAQTIAEVALQAWADAKDKKLASKLLKEARPTEPMLFNAISAAEQGHDSEVLICKFKNDKEKIFKFGAELIKNKSVVFTHCHSSTVVGILIEAKKRGKKFEVYNTETRPLFQGRVTARELAEAGIRVHHIVDSAGLKALAKADLFLIGADWISQKGIANKIGTEMFAELASHLKIPVYCCSHSWKFSKANIEIEQRAAGEVWPAHPKGVLVENPAFEVAEAKHIAGIISEFGILSFDKFLRTVG